MASEERGSAAVEFAVGGPRGWMEPRIVVDRLSVARSKVHMRGIFGVS